MKLILMKNHIRKKWKILNNVLKEIEEEIFKYLKKIIFYILEHFLIIYYSKKIFVY